MFPIVLRRPCHLLARTWSFSIVALVVSSLLWLPASAAADTCVAEANAYASRRTSISVLARIPTFRFSLLFQSRPAVTMILMTYGEERGWVAARYIQALCQDRYMSGSGNICRSWRASPPAHSTSKRIGTRFTAASHSMPNSTNGFHRLASRSLARARFTNPWLRMAIGSVGRLTELRRIPEPAYNGPGKHPDVPCRYPPAIHAVAQVTPGQVLDTVVDRYSGL